MGKEPVPAGVGRAGKNVTPRPGTRPAHRLAGVRKRDALIILRVADLAAALLDGHFEHPVGAFSCCGHVQIIGVLACESSFSAAC